MEAMAALFDRKLEPVTAKINKLEEKVGKQEERLTALEARIEGGISQGTVTTNSSRSSGAFLSLKFVPTFIEIKNICAFSERRTKGINRDQAETLVNSLTAHLPASLKNKIGDFEVFGTRANKVRVHVIPPAAVEVSLIFKEVLAEDPNLKFNNNTLYITIEREPLVQKMFATGGKARAFLDAKAKGIHESGVASCSWAPDWNLSVGGDVGYTVVGTIRSDASIDWDPATIHTAFGMTVETIMVEFAGFRQQ